MSVTADGGPEFSEDFLSALQQDGTLHERRLLMLLGRVDCVNVKEELGNLRFSVPCLRVSWNPKGKLKRSWIR